MLEKERGLRSRPRRPRRVRTEGSGRSPGTGAQAGVWAAALGTVSAAQLCGRI